MTTSKPPYIDIVFDGPPSHESGRFIEVENEQGQSIKVGEWIKPELENGYWRLRIATERGVSSLAERIHAISTSKGFSPPDMDNLPEKLMLSVSELSECMEEHRKGRGLLWFQHEKECHSNQCSDEGSVDCNCHAKPEGVLAELADSVIRNLHMMHSLLLENEEEFETFQNGLATGQTVGSIIKMKVDYNEGRPHMHGGNSY